MKDPTLSRRAVLGGAITAVLVPGLASEAFGVQPKAAPVARRGAALSSGKPRYAHTATAMQDGRVLVVGGYHTSEKARSNDAMPSTSVEILDPSSGRWSSAAPLQTPRARHAATLLPDGRVAVAGGVSGTALSSVEVYDPSTDTWSKAEPLPRPMYDHAMVAVGNAVVVSGGENGTSAMTHPITPATTNFAP